MDKREAKIYVLEHLAARAEDMLDDWDPALSEGDNNLITEAFAAELNRLNLRLDRLEAAA